MEEILLDIMYDLPSMENVAKVVIDYNSTSEDINPILIYSDQQKVAKTSS
jgi:ATP-dependent Clp protease ATP-binding subunit ClpX